MCIVDRIIGTTVFVRLEDFNNLEGTISFPEIAPGRIRNIRDYAFPGKRIICKILAIKPQGVELSLRRVKVNERNGFNESHKREKSLTALLRTLLKEKFEETLKNIKENESSLVDLIDKAKENPKELEKYVKKPEAEKILGALKEKKIKEITILSKFSLSSKSPNGIVSIKEIIKESSRSIENLETSYVAAGKYLAKIKAKDPRIADQQIRKFLDSVENLARKKNCVYNLEKD
jgi:translation initiation factor 2 alpha subunit (eIF-2alpha)